MGEIKERLAEFGKDEINIEWQLKLKVKEKAFSISSTVSCLEKANCEVELTPS